MVLHGVFLGFGNDLQIQSIKRQGTLVKYAIICNLGKDSAFKHPLISI